MDVGWLAGLLGAELMKLNLQLLNEIKKQRGRRNEKTQQGRTEEEEEAQRDDNLAKNGEKLAHLRLPLLIHPNRKL